MKIMPSNGLLSCLVNYLVLFFLFNCHLAQADTNHLAGYVGISTVGPFQTVEVAGNVGIGTSTPGTALDVNGTARMVGFNLSTTPSNGYLLTSDASGNGTWAASTNGMTLVATASPSSASSFTINGLSPAVRYKLILNLKQNTSTGTQYVQLNNDSGSNYQWFVGYWYFSGSSSSGDGSTSATNLVLAGNVSVGWCTEFDLTFQTIPGNNDDVILTGLGANPSNTSALYYSDEYTGSTSLSSLTIGTTAGTFTGSAALYSLN